MKYLLFIWSLMLFQVQPARGCTAFCMQSEQRVLLGKNLDWPVDKGLILINRAGIRKSSLPATFGTISWISRYSSITFNQFGKEFPLGGMNEKGLVVEELNMPTVQTFSLPSKYGINEFQLVQYMLDNFSSVEEIEEAMKQFQIEPLLLSLHYLIMDSKGNSIVMEFDGEKFRLYPTLQTGFPILSNNLYNESIRYLKNFSGFGGDQEIRHRSGSNERFVSVASMLSKNHTESLVKTSFAILDTVSQSDTRWSIVYDATDLKIHLKSHSCRGTRQIILQNLLATEETSVLGIDITECSSGDKNSFRVITPRENRLLIQSVLEQLNEETELAGMQRLIDKLSSYGFNPSEEELVRELNHEVRSLPKGSPLGYGDSYLQEAADWDKYWVYGLGEATHGTLDFFELKQRLFRYLVEHHQCRVLAYEYSYRKSLLVNDYIHHKYHCLDSLFKGDLWIQDNEIVRELIQWMRQFNDGKEEHEKVHFIGIDNQVDAMRLKEVIDQIASFLPEFRLDTSIFPYNLPGKKVVAYQKMTETEYEEIKRAIWSLEDEVKSCTSAKPSSLQIAVHLVRSLQKSHDFLYHYYASGKNLRDYQMAENILELINETGKNVRVAVWAHNAHVACNPYYYANGGASMGWHLRQALKEQYLSIATSFSTGEFTAVMLDSNGNDTPPLTCRITSAPPLGSFNTIFHQARSPQFLLNIPHIDRGTPLYQFLSETRPMIGVGDLYLGAPEKHFTEDRIINLVQAHNLLFYFTDTKPLPIKETSNEN